MKWPSIRPLLSTRRPLHGPPAQNMHMKMRHALAAIRSVIDNEPKTRVMETFLPRDGLRDMDQVAQKRFVGDGGGRHARDFPFRDDQNMDRGCGMDIMKSQAAVVFIGDPGRDFAGDDLRENRAHSVQCSGGHRARQYFSGEALLPSAGAALCRSCPPQESSPLVLRIFPGKLLLDLRITLFPEVREIGRDLHGPLVGRENLDRDRLAALGHREAGHAV